MAPARRPIELRDLPPHTEAKHRLLRTYLGAWFPIMARYNPRVIYYDAFAGPGEYEDGQPGSLMIALQTLIDHRYFAQMNQTQFLFLLNEQDAGCAEHLQVLVDKLRESRKPWPPNVAVFVTNTTFIDLTTTMLDAMERRNTLLAPTFAFVDPVGVAATTMSVLQRLTDYPKGELLVYFAHDFVLRFCGAGNIDQALTDLFGTDEYKDASLLSGAQRSQYISGLYKRQLHDVCQFPYIQGFAMYDNRGKRIYDLYYCTREPLGLDRMKQAMWKMAPFGDFSFHDRYAGYDVIFGDTVDTSPLRSDLLHQFAGQAVTIEAIVDYVIASTPFASNHVKSLALAEMQRQNLISSPNQRRRNTYPDGTIIVFPSA
jgi:three-Cys-motif partner protein